MPTLAIDDPDYYISSVAFWAFVEKMAAKEGIENLGYLVGRQAGANAVAPGYSKVLARSPSLYHGLTQTCRAVAAEISRTIMTVSRLDSNTTGFCHKTSFGINHPNHHQMEWFAIMVLIDIIREFTGASWFPKKIGLMSYHAPAFVVREYMPDCQFLNGQACGYVCIDTPLLSLPPLSKNTNRIVTSEAQVLTSSFGEPAVDFVDSLKQVLPAYLREGAPPIALAAEIANTSVRSLQRELSKDKLTYLGLLAQIRFEMASRLLKDKNTQVQEIAYKLGYNDASHFARAFRRIAGISPSEYRRANS
jgi:AraC-like DNA-binding protein